MQKRMSTWIALSNPFIMVVFYNYSKDPSLSSGWHVYLKVDETSSARLIKSSVILNLIQDLTKRSSDLTDAEPRFRPFDKLRAGSAQCDVFSMTNLFWKIHETLSYEIFRIKIVKSLVMAEAESKEWNGLDSTDKRVHLFYRKITSD